MMPPVEPSVSYWSSVEFGCGREYHIIYSNSCVGFNNVGRFTNHFHIDDWEGFIIEERRFELEDLTCLGNDTADLSHDRLSNFCRVWAGRLL